MLREIDIFVNNGRNIVVVVLFDVNLVIMVISVVI